MTDCPHEHEHPARAVGSATPEERRTRLAIGLAVGATLTELIAGKFSGSLALVADGWHLVGDVGVLTLSALAYWFARTRQGSARFTFGTGKVPALAGYTNGVLLVVVSLSMLAESAERLVTPKHIDLNEALAATIFGSVVSVANLLLVGGPRHHHHEDHNRRAVYLHLLSDVLTNVLTVAALIAIRLGGPIWLDVCVAIFASLVILRWGAMLCRDSSHLLLDAAAGSDPAIAVRTQLDLLPGVRVRDLRVWPLGEGAYACMAALTATIARQPHEYRAAIREALHVEHLAVEVELIQAMPLSPVRDLDSAKRPGARDVADEIRQVGSSLSCT